MRSRDQNQQAGAIAQPLTFALLQRAVTSYIIFYTNLHFNTNLEQSFNNSIKLKNSNYFFMVNTRSQSARNNSVDKSGMNRHSDAESRSNK